MNTNKNNILVASVLCVLISSTGCTIKDSEQLKAATDKLDTATKTASDALEIERKARPKTRRLEAIEYYILTKNLNPSSAAFTPDFTKSDINGSFARFVCAGSSSMLREKNAFAYVRQYSSGLSDILNPGEDSLGSQYDRFMKLQAAKTENVPPPNKSDSNAKQNCIKEINSIVSTWTPAPTSDSYDENPAAAIPLIIEAVKALHQLAITVSKKVTDYEAKMVFSEYVKGSHENFSRVMTEEFSEDRVNSAWTHRKAVALQMPLMTFKRIFESDKTSKATDHNNRIRELGLLTHQQLAEFDDIRVAPSPAYVRQGIIEAEDKLLKLARNENVSMGDVVNFISGLVKDFEDVKKQYEGANVAIRSAITEYKK